MNPETVWEKIKGLIGHVGWRLFLWSIDMTDEQYSEAKYQDELRHRNRCTLPPPGWYCTRDKGHEGPCAAIESGTVIP